MFMWWWKHVEPRVTTAKQYGIKNEVLLGTHWELVELFGNLMGGGNNKASTLNPKPSNKFLMPSFRN